MHLIDFKWAYVTLSLLSRCLRAHRVGICEMSYLSIDFNRIIHCWAIFTAKGLRIVRIFNRASYCNSRELSLCIQISIFIHSFHVDRLGMRKNRKATEVKVFSIRLHNTGTGCEMRENEMWSAEFERVSKVNIITQRNLIKFQVIAKLCAKAFPLP